MFIDNHLWGLGEISSEQRFSYQHQRSEVSGPTSGQEGLGRTGPHFQMVDVDRREEDLIFIYRNQSCKHTRMEEGR